MLELWQRIVRFLLLGRSKLNHKLCLFTRAVFYLRLFSHQNGEWLVEIDFCVGFLWFWKMHTIKQISSHDHHTAGGSLRGFLFKFKCHCIEIRQMTKLKLKEKYRKKRVLQRGEREKNERRKPLSHYHCCVLWRASGWIYFIQMVFDRCCPIKCIAMLKGARIQYSKNSSRKDNIKNHNSYRSMKNKP